MLALALADDAFESKFNSLKDIYTLIVPPDTDRIPLQWDSKSAGRPVFRDVDGTANGIRVSNTKCRIFETLTSSHSPRPDLWL